MLSLSATLPATAQFCRAPYPSSVVQWLSHNPPAILATSRFVVKGTLLSRLGTSQGGAVSEMRYNFSYDVYLLLLDARISMEQLTALQ
jgi:hypothetical protein